MVDWNNLKCPLCGIGVMNKEPFGKYVIIDQNVFKPSNRSEHSVKADVYVCRECKHIVLKKRPI